MQMNVLRILMFPLLLFSMSCNSSVKLWGSKTAHEAYADKIEKTPEGKQWIAVSKNTLATPHSIKLPYRQIGNFPASEPKALTLEFPAKQGEQLVIALVKKDSTGTIPYADLFIKDGADIDHLLSADTTQMQFSFDANQTSTYLLRLQPELYSSVSYDLSISVAPSLDFPVAGTKAKAGSFWGDDRDAGRRKHEGIDIFAPKLTPAIAAADGYITGVQEGGLGGKTVWMKVADKNYYLYYAHLDKQLVEEGERIRKGDTLGLIGNTGNAKYTPPHLHFGIYTHSGPVDPWPFVNKTVRTAGPVTARELDVALQWTNTKKASSEVMIPLAVTATDYLAESADGKIISAPFKSVKIVKDDKLVSQQKIVTADPSINSNKLK
jgi:murein DD-endopeptidase MepM/ murein hydrolase activator NlpD